MLIARDSGVIGRFGRTGMLRGSLANGVLTADWRDVRRTGWITMTFAGDYTSCICLYGLDRGPALARAILTRVFRKRPRLKTR